MSARQVGPVRRALARWLLPAMGKAITLDEWRAATVYGGDDEAAARLTLNNDADYLGALGKNPWVYKCVDTIASAFTRPDWWFERTGGDKQQERVEIPELHALLDAPNPWQTCADLFEATITNLLLCGKAYWLLSEMSALSLFETKTAENGELEIVMEADGLTPKLKQLDAPLKAGLPKEIWSLRPDLVKPIRSKEPGVLFDHFDYEPGQDGKKTPIPAEFVIYFRRYDPMNMSEGLGVIEAARKVIESDERAADWNLRFYKNSARPDMFLGSDQDLSEEDIQRYLAIWKSQFMGQLNAHRVAMVGGGLKPQTISSNPKDMDWVNARNMSRDQILGMFGVPPALAGIFEQSKSMANTGEQDRIFWGGTMEPQFRRFSQRVTLDLVSRYRPDAKMVFEDMVKADLLQQSTTAYRLVSAGIWSPNEARDEFGWGPAFPGGEQHFVFGMSNVIGKDATADDLPAAPVEPAVPPAEPPPGEAPAAGEPAPTPSPPAAEAPKALAPRSAGKRGRGAKKSLTLDEQETAQGRFQRETKDEFATQQRDVLRAVRESEALANLAGKRVKVGTEDEVAAVVADFIDWDEADARYQGAMRSPYEATLTESGSSALGDLGVGVSFDITNPRVQDWLAGYLPELAGGVSTTTRADIARVLSEGIAQGENISALEGRVRAIFSDAKVFRAEAIARTETSRAMQQGALEGWRQSEVVASKEWVCGSDPCDECAPMDGEVVGIDEAFSNGDMICEVHPNENCDIVPIVAEG